jgi:hypothetical protein
MKWLVFTGMALVLLLAGPIPAKAMQELSEDELGQVTAGAASADLVDGMLQFQYGREAGNGRYYIEASGSAAQLVEPLPGGAGSYLIVSDNAQSNLSSFITVNAVNSNVQLLINLNISIDSVVGTVGQSNTGTSQ